MADKPWHHGRPYRRFRAIVLARSRTCALCGHDGSDSADHIISPTVGGAWHDPDNGQPAHYRPCPTCGVRCNLVKGAKPMSGVMQMRRSRAW